MTHAAVVVPGILGSELWSPEDRVWPGPFLSLIFASDELDKVTDPDLKVGNIILSYSGSKQYRSLLDDLETCEFYMDSDPRRLYPFPYDWRRDNRETAEKLAAVLDEAVGHGGVTEISLIGHSMGGLVCRYYLESGEYAGRPGLAAVRRLVTLGTPHRGAPLALGAALGIQSRLFLTAKQVHQIASDPDYPSLYQLLPPPGEPFVWNDDDAADFAEMDIYSDGLAAALNLVPENLKAAREFHSKLDVGKRPHHDGRPVRYFFFTGTHMKTAAAFKLLEKAPGDYRPRPQLVDRGGDGTVPAWSGALMGIQGQLVGGEHGTIYRNGDLRTTLAVILGKKGVLAGEPECVEVALREHVARPDSEVNVSLGFPAQNASLDGALVVQPIIIGDDEKVSFDVPVASYKLNYTGPKTPSLNVIINAPTHPNVYRVAYIPANQAEPAGSDELFVQQS